MNNQQAKRLLEKYSAGKCSKEEKSLVESWYLHSDHSSEIPSHADIENAMDIVKNTLPLAYPGKRKLWPSIAAAASLAIVISLVFYNGSKKKHSGQTASVSDVQNAMPLKNGVSLKTESSPVIKLTKSGPVRFPDGSAAAASAGQLDYSGTKGNGTIHTLSNNSADRFILILNDGTEASLDIGSSITYPTAFTGTSREVSVTGQTYFKVTHNAKHPFRVRTRDVVIEDLGTQFNIESFDEKVQTTLIEGSASVSLASNKIILKPGEQAETLKGSIEKRDVDVKTVTCWLQNDFIFNHEPLENILIRLERMYNVRFTWQDTSLKKLRFNGSVSRKKKLSNILDYIRKTGPIDFVTVKGKIMVIRKK